MGTLGLRSFFSTHWQWVFLGQIAAILGSLALVKIAASVSSSAVFGQFALILAVAVGCSAVLFAPINGWALRYYQEAREARRIRGYYHALAVALLSATAIAAGISAVAVVVLERQLHRMNISPGMVAIGVAVGVGSGASDTVVTVANAAFFRRAAALSLVLSAWVRVVAIGAAYAFGGRSAAWLGAAVAVALIAFLPLQVELLRRSEEREPPEAERRLNRDYLPSLVHYALPLLVWGVPGYVLAFGDRLLLAYFTDSATVGLYAAMAASTINLMNAASGAANRVLEPTLFAAAGAGTDNARVVPALRMVNVTTALIVPIGGALLLVYYFLPGPIISLFASSGYRSDASDLWLLLLGSTLFLVSQQLMYRGFILKRPGAYVPLRFLHAGALAGGLIVVLPRYGLHGMILTILAAHALQLGLVLATNRFRLRAPAGAIPASPIADRGYDP